MSGDYLATFTFTLKIDCDDCGQMVPLNGPLRRVACKACQRSYQLTPERWVDQVCSRADGYDILNNAYTCRDTASRDPFCARCKKHFPLAREIVGQEGPFDCPHCGQPVDTFPAPDWLKEVLPAAVQIIGGQREQPTEAGARALTPDETAARPVVLSCPNCDAPLKVTSEAERIFPCTHCDSDIYLPDAVWRRLHPVQTVGPWTIVYAARKLETAADLRKREEERARERHKIQQAADRAAREEQARETARRRSRRLLLWLSLALGAALLLILLLRLVLS